MTARKSSVFKSPVFKAPARKSRSVSSATKMAELGMAVPQVMAHRLTRMAMAGPILSARDHKEFSGMVLEKQLAFTQAWWSIMTEASRLQQQMFMGALTGRPFALQMGLVQRAVDRATSSGLAPIHRKATSNAKRLSRTKIR